MSDFPTTEDFGNTIYLNLPPGSQQISPASYTPGPYPGTAYVAPVDLPSTDPGLGGNGGYPQQTTGPGSTIPVGTGYPNPTTTGAPGSQSLAQQIVTGLSGIYDAGLTAAQRMLVNGIAGLILILGIWLLLGESGRQTIIETARRGAEVAAA